MKKILVIEDSAPTRSMFLECLEAEGFDTISAENGLVGVQQAQEQLPDLVICDIRMPQLDGYGVLMSLRQNPVTAMIPFIFLTAKANKAEVQSISFVSFANTTRPRPKLGATCSEFRTALSRIKKIVNLTDKLYIASRF